VTVGGVTAV